MSDARHAALSDVLRSYRLRAGLSQEELAERASVSAKAIGAIEQGLRKAPYRQTIVQIAQALRLSDADTALLVEAADRSRRLGGTRSGAPAEAVTSTLPRPMTTFIERPEVGMIAALAREHRCVTVVGPGGIGKTRTAVEAADRLARTSGRSAYFIDLSAIRDTGKIATEIAGVLGCAPTGEEEANSAAIVAALAARDCLLVFDNCEQIVAGVAAITGDLLASCPLISVLATSRQRLGLSGESVFRLPPLNVPGDAVVSAEAAFAFPAVALFVQRARLAGAVIGLDAAQIRSVVEICAKLDGVPLAIELAAARLPAMGLRTLRDRIRDALARPGFADLPERQQTLDATISWSFELLSPEEQLLLVRVSIFPATFVLAAVEAICSDDRLPQPAILGVLIGLVEKSLVNATLTGEGSQYRLLESIRAFGQQRLYHDGAFADLARRHALWYADQAELFHEQLQRGTVSEQLVELDNPRFAIDWCLASGMQDDLRLAARIAVGAQALWKIKRRRPELRERLVDVLDRLADEAANYELIGLLWKARIDTIAHPDRTLVDDATPYLERAGRFAEVATLNSTVAATEARAGDFARANASRVRATAYFEADAERRKGPHYYYFGSVGAWIFFSQRDYTRARAELENVLTAMDTYGAPPNQRGDTMQLLAEIEDASGDPAAAIRIAHQVLEMYGPAAHSNTLGVTMSNLCGYLLRGNGDLGEAKRYGEQALRALAGEQTKDGQWDVLLAAQNLAATVALQGRSHVAAVLLGFIDAELRRSDHKQSETDRASHEILVTSVRSHLAERTLADLCAEGARLTYHEAVDLLLLSQP